MPWKSGAQQRWGHTAAGEKALGGADKVHEWDQATDFKHLPRRSHKSSFPRDTHSSATSDPFRVRPKVGWMGGK